MSTSAGCAPRLVATRSRRFGVRGIGLTRPNRRAWPVRGLLWVDIAWAIFAIINLLGMLVFATWETVPFHFIWVSLTLLYGFRVWRLTPTLSVLGAIILVTAAMDPDFLHLDPIAVEPLLVSALHRWAPTLRQWRLRATDEVMVDADADRLSLAIDALVENAVKHTRPDDWIELSVRRNHGVEIIVADSGAGILAEDLDRIFERFGRSDASRKGGADGVGLGLSIVKTIAEAHGGTLRVRSTVGKGTEFDILLAEAGQASRPPAPVGLGSGSGAR